MHRLLAAATLVALVVYAAPKTETPETPPGDICQARKGPRPKKDVEIQPYCPDNTPTPEVTPASPAKKVSP